jgi:hypothetical protein
MKAGNLEPTSTSTALIDNGGNHFLELGAKKFDVIIFDSQIFSPFQIPYMVT